MSLPSRPVALAGRDDLLARLDDVLTTGNQPRTAVLCGLGGVGKTSLAAEYAHRHVAEVAVAWLVPAGDPAVLAQSMADLAAQLTSRGRADPRDPVASVHEILAAHPTDWLVIFDDARDEESVRRFLPTVGRGRVIVTSQSQHWPGSDVLPVGVLEADVAARFLASRTPDPDKAAARMLADDLGGLPLALEQAAAFMAEAEMTIPEYLDLYHEHRARLLARGKAAGHSATVAATMGLALSRLHRESPCAAGLLRLLAPLAPEPVPVALLLADGALAEQLDIAAAGLGPLLGDRLAVADAISVLRRYSLVTRAKGGLVQVHRLVQAITTDYGPPEIAGAWQRAAEVIVASAIPADTTLPESWPTCAELLPHALAILPPTDGGLRRIASYLGESGSYAAARDLFRRIADDCARVLGPAHEDTLSNRSDLANWTGLAEGAALGRDMSAALVPVCERLLGPEHPTTLTTRGNFARWTGEAGDVVQAWELSAALVPVCEEVFGREHPRTLTARCNLASWSGLAGDTAGARDLYAALVPVCERVLGPEHPTTLTIRGNLANSTGDAGDPVGAWQQYAQVLPASERVLGPEHPTTLTMQNNRVYWTGEAGDAAGARDGYAALVPVSERVLGSEHPTTLAIVSNLAYWTGKTGNAAGARDGYAALVPVCERVLGPEHPTTLTIRGNFANWTGEAGDAARASDLQAGLLPVCERILGPEHPDTRSIRTDLARWTLRARWR